ncbi:hypothetical protein [Clostridium perfringens]|uniref:Uncharacterized protein n=1 Tax=Clostridium perfringens (strain 13 / Type A) TaxID=195102 RepID=Q8XLD7_CLOPE|nr:hypothetical protein [Clostridium perfringens]BAB80811.1 hypothetical protein [Clostridium perfringens str. 13]
MRACKDLGINLVPVIINEELLDEDEKLKKLLATNFGREKNDPVKQGRVYEKYEKLCGIQRGGDRRSNQKIFGLVTQEQIAKELGYRGIPYPLHLRLWNESSTKLKI